MKIIRKDTSGYSIYNDSDFDKECIENMFIHGFKKLHEIEPPSNYNEEIMELKKEILEREDGDYECRYIAVISIKKINQSISLFKQQLADTDYKVIKNMEAQLANKELPYDSVALHTERQALRDKINELEELLK